MWILERRLSFGKSKKYIGGTPSASNKYAYKEDVIYISIFEEDVDLSGEERRKYSF